jgi:acetyl esterase/lipase
MKAGVVLALASFIVACAAEPTPVPLWPGQPPGETGALPPENDTTKPTDNKVGGRPLIRLGNVSTPTLTVYPADPAKHTGAAVLVFPGGGYNILALDLEGTEVCAWLNSIGVTAVLVKYRVPRRPGGPYYAPPLQDAQRAIGLVRQRAAELRLDPKRIGVLGFSAGGHLAAALGSNHAERSYPIVDAADQLSCRPDFCVLVYPAYLTVKEKNNAPAPELSLSATHTPPTFIVVAENDNAHVESGLFYYVALQRARVPAELHAYPDGGHGFGLRKTSSLSSTWPDRAADWMRASGWLTRAK